MRRLGARKAKTAQVPIIFDPMVSTSILEHIFEGINGDSVYRGASFLAGKLGQKIAGDNVNIIDDGTIPGGFGTSPFDGEGVPTRRTVVIENGVLKSYLLNTYTAKKLKMQTTGNASRGLAGTPGIGPGNYFLQAGTKTPKELIGGIKERPIRDRVSRQRREPGDRRLFARGFGDVDFGWRVCVSGGRDYGGGKFEGIVF